MKLIVRTIKYAAWTVGVLALVGVFLYFEESTTILIVKNDAQSSLTNVKIEMARKVVWTGTIEPGKSIFAFGIHTDREGAIDLSFTLEGEEAHFTFGYITTIGADSYRIYITSKQQVRLDPFPTLLGATLDKWIAPKY